MRYDSVVVGSDGSPTALRAVDAAAEAARANGVRLIVVCAYHPVSPSEQALVSTGVDGEDGKHRVTAKKTAKGALDRSVERARAIAPDTTGELVKDDAVEALLRIVDRNSLLVVGSRGLNRWSRRILGSVPSDLVVRVPCDIVIVRTTDDSRL